MAKITGQGLRLTGFWYKTIMSLEAPGSYWGVNRISVGISKKCLRLACYLLLPSVICLWTWLWNAPVRVKHCIAWHSGSTEPAHLALGSDSIKLARSQHVLKHLRGMGGEPGRGLSHFGHPLEIWVKKSWREPLKWLRLLDFCRFSGQASPQLEHPLQSVGAFPCSLHSCQRGSVLCCVTVCGAHSGPQLLMVSG